MPPFDIKRIEEMEASYDALLQAMAEIEQGCAAEAASRKAALLPEIDRLAAYYSSEAWKADFAADEAGLLPAGMKRGVLSEDGVYTFWSVSRKWDRVTNQEFEVPKYQKPDISE